MEANTGCLHVASGDLPVTTGRHPTNDRFLDYGIAGYRSWWSEPPAILAFAQHLRRLHFCRSVADSNYVFL